MGRALLLRSRSRACSLGAVVLVALSGCHADPEAAGECSGEACAPPCPPIAKSDGAGGCTPILPSECAPDAIGIPGETSCRTIGVSTCGEGFVADGAGGCSATLPAAACGPGTMALPGETTCRAPSSCDEPLPSGALVYVDAKASAGGDGTSARPFAKVADAIAAATAGATIVLADGEYAETLLIKKAVRLVGRCAAKVTLRGTTAGSPVVSISGADVELHRLAITGPSVGVSVLRSASKLEGVWLHDLGASGVQIGGGTALVTALDSVLIERTRDSGVAVSAAVGTLDRSVIRDVSQATGQGMGLYLTRAAGVPANLTMKHSVVERVTHAGAKVYGSTFLAEDSLVRDVGADGSGAFGFGVYADIDATGKASRAELRRLVLERTTESAVAIFASEAVVEDTAIRDVRPNPKTVGYGVFAGLSGKSTKPATVTVARTLIDGAAQAGLSASGSSLTVDTTIVRNTKAGTTTDRSGFGADVSDAAGVQGVFTLRDSLLDHNRSISVHSQGTVSTLERCVVRDTVPEVDGELGLGVIASSGSETTAPIVGSLVLRDSLVEKTFAIGVGTIGAAGTVERCVVRETRGQSSDGRFGDGVFAFVGLLAPVPGSMSVTDSLITGSTRAGVAAFGSTVALTGSRLSCNDFDINVETVRTDVGTYESKLDDGGKNACGCGVAADCRASSSGLESIVSDGVL